MRRLDGAGARYRFGRLHRRGQCSATKDRTRRRQYRAARTNLDARSASRTSRRKQRALEPPVRRKFGIVAVAPVALAALIALAAGDLETPSPATSASQEVEGTVQIALVNVHNPVSVDSDAARLVADTNRERASRGIAPLVRDPDLDRCARAKAVDMALRGYFGHTSPDGVTFQDRMRAARWPTAYVGENIAFDRNEPAAELAFVQSPPHLSNIVDPRQHRIGTAAVNVGARETFYVEDFSQ